MTRTRVKDPITSCEKSWLLTFPENILSTVSILTSIEINERDIISILRIIVGYASGGKKPRSHDIRVHW